MDGLASLLEKSLLTYSEGEGGAARFGMLETIREFALEQLAASGEAETVQQQHAAFYLALAERAAPKLVGPEQVVWLDWLEMEYDNLRAALRWTSERGKVELCVRLGVALIKFWEVRRSSDEGRHWLERALPKAAALPTLLRAKLLQGLGELTYPATSMNGKKSALFLESLALFRQVDDKRGIAEVLVDLGILARSAGDTVMAAERHQAALALYQELGDQRGAASCLNYLAHVAMLDGDGPRELALREESLALFRAVHDAYGMAWVLNSLGEYERRFGYYTSARRYYDECLAIAQHGHFPNRAAMALHNLGYVSLHEGRFDQAQAQFLESALLFKAEASSGAMASALIGLACVLARQGHCVHAARLLGAVEATQATLGHKLWPTDEREYERAVALIRSSPSAAAYKTAWAEGRALTLEQAVEYALAAAEEKAGET